MKRESCISILLFLCSLLAGAQTVRVGIIGLDTSHSVAFTSQINDPQSTDPRIMKYEVVAAYPYGTRTIPSATDRIPIFVQEIQRYGVRIVDSIAELLSCVDCVLLETNDGNLHLEQAAEVFASGRKIYIDKPLGATLAQAIALYELAERYGIRFFSSSAVRFSEENVKIRSGAYGKVSGADCYSPHVPEPSHPDFGYYGLHGVEELYTVMGTGCKSVSRVHTETGDVVVGRWDDGRIGTFRAIVEGPYAYGGTAYIGEKAVPTGGYTGYSCLVDAILDFFETGEPPVGKEETLELFTFMKASNMSLGKGGKEIPMEKAWKAGMKEARKILKKYSK